MTAVSHALIGSAIAAKVTDPVSISLLAFTSHFLCDAIPHWDLGTNWRLRPKSVTGFLAIMETLVAIGGSFWIFSHFIPDNQLLLLAIVMSLLPDWLEIPYYLYLPHPPRVFYYIYKIQSLVHSRLHAPYGIITQIVVVGLFLLAGFGL